MVIFVNYLGIMTGIKNIGIRVLLLTVLFIAAVALPIGFEKSDFLKNRQIISEIRIDNSLADSILFIKSENDIDLFMKKWDLKGASVAVAREGKLLYARGFGYASVEDSILTQPYNRFRVASISKLITAVAIMKLQEEGKLSVNDNVFGADGILNDTLFSHPKDNRVYGITVGHLLAHKGGWSQRYGDQMFMPDVVSKETGVSMPVDTKTIVRFALDKKLQYTPGMGQAYSNLGYSILGLVIEKVSGMSYEKYCEKNVLEPLGIYDMLLAHNLKSQQAPYEVSYYVTSDARPKPSVYGTGELLPACYGGNDIEALGAAGAWIATAPDLMKLLLAIDGFNTRKDFLSPESIKYMTDPENGYAPVGWRGTLEDGSWWRTGTFAGTSGMMKRLPDGTAWVVLFNSSAWNGPELSSSIDRMMTRFVGHVDKWPSSDLFSYYVPVPLKEE
jgi:CubicO group peptidase (beta-lactamase class C family)